MPTALIVEDEPEANRLLALLVQLRGYGTESAFTGGEALAKVDLAHPDIVFLDLMLPDVNGYEVCKALKSRKDTTLIPVVMVTARAADENRLQSYCDGADQYVPKPYTPDEIFDALAHADEWTRRVAAGQAAGGEFLLSANDGGETLRQIARLRSLLLACTPMDDRAACQVKEALQEIAAEADAWGREAGAPAVASLAYRTLSDRAELTLRDLSGWLRDDPRTAAERWPVAVGPGRLVEAEVRQPADTLTFSLPYFAG